MKIKNKESFLQGMRYAAGIGPAQGLDWWKDAFEDRGIFEGDEDKQEFLACFEQMMLGYADLMEQEFDLNALGIRFEE